MPWKNDQVSPQETAKILEIAKQCLAIEGDFVEFGCYKGDTSLLLAEVMQNSVDNPVHKLWIYDSFEGLPDKTTEDTSTLGQDFQKGALFTTKRELKQRFLKANLPLPIIKKAWFSNLSSSDIPAKIAFAFLDGDLYNSINSSLQLIEANLSQGSTIIIHDYSNPALPGVALAVDQWCRKNNKTPIIFHTMAIIHC